MSQIPSVNDDNSSVAASDFVQFDQPDEVPDEEARQLHPQFGRHRNQLNWSMDMGTNCNYGNGLQELKWMMTNLEAKNQMLQGKVENLELKAEIRALKENAEQKANNQSLEAKFAKMLSTQNAQHQKEMAQLKDQFAKMLAEQQTQMMAQFESLEKKLKEAELRAQMEKNELEEVIDAKQQKLEKFQKEMDEKNSQAIDSNRKKLDYMWGRLMGNGNIVANPKGMVWDEFKTKATISECGLKIKITGNNGYGQYVFATKGYAISGEQCRKDIPFPGTILYYFELTTTGIFGTVGFSDGNDGGYISTNSYVISPDISGHKYWFSGKWHKFDCPAGSIAGGNVVGCGLLLDSKNELAVFFTLNGILLDKKTSINPTVGRLYPTAYIYPGTVLANFGDNLVAKPFKYDIDKCPELVFE